MGCRESPAAKSGGRFLVTGCGRSVLGRGLIPGGLRRCRQASSGGDCARRARFGVWPDVERGRTVGVGAGGAGGWAAIPLLLLLPWPGARPGTSAAAFAPGLRVVCLPRCLPSWAWRGWLRWPRFVLWCSSWVVHSMTTAARVRRLPFGVGRPPGTPLRSAPRGGTSPAHRPFFFFFFFLKKKKNNKRCASRPRGGTSPRTPSSSPGTGPGCAVWPGGTTPGTPAALRAPARWYLAETPEAHEAQSPGSLCQPGGTTPRNPPAALRARAVVPRRDTGRSPGTGPGPRWAG